MLNANRMKRRIGTLWLFACLVAAVFLLSWKSKPEHELTDQLVSASSKATSEQLLLSIPIEKIRVGKRVAGFNPEISSDQRDGFQQIQPEAWRRVSLYLRSEGASDVEVVLLRPVSWLDDSNVEVNSTVKLELDELGISGPAQVLSIEPCPEIQGAVGAIVTGTFKHKTVGQIAEIRIEGEPVPISSTSNHPYWSEDRQKFVRADTLRVGERLLAYGKQVRVEQVTFREASEWVYNLEVFGEHVYSVGQQGILVHNNCGRIALGFGEHMGEFISSLKSQGRDAFEWRTPQFESLMPRNVNLAQGLEHVVKNAPAIEFNGKGFSIEKFQNWLKIGQYRYPPKSNAEALMTRDVTNYELYLILKNNLQNKTTFHGLDWREAIRGYEHLFR